MAKESKSRLMATLRRILKVFLWTVMAAVLTVVAVVMCMVNLISEESLTALTTSIANKTLDAEVSIQRVKLSLEGKLPLLRLELDSLTVLSKPMMRLDRAKYDSLPEWSDTLLTLGRFEGGVNVGALLRGKIDLYDVELVEPGINILNVDENLAGYMIFKTEDSDSSDTTAVSVPEIAINRFAIIRPRPVRYYDMPTGQHLELKLKTFAVDGVDAPAYSLDISGNMAMPALALYSLENLNFGANGTVKWKPDEPMKLAMKDFELFGNFIKGRMDVNLDFTEDIVLNEYNLEIAETRIEELVSLVPDSVLRSFGLERGRLSTECAVNLKVKSTAPFNLSVDTIPNTDIELAISPGAFSYDKIKFKNISGVLAASLKGNDLDQAVFEGRDFSIVGPATDLLINVVATQVSGDPLIKAAIAGKTDISLLPVQLRELVKGYMKGRLTANVDIEGRPSMFTTNNFHKLNVNGDLKLDGFYYLSGDTATMFDVKHATFDFGTKKKINSTPMLAAKIMVDSAEILQDKYSMKISDLSLGVGVANTAPSHDTTVVVPMGGDLKLGKFYLTVLGDSVAFYMRNGHGRITMNRYNNELRRPLFGLNMDVAQISTGSPMVRFMISDANINASAFKLNSPKIPASVERAADSIRISYPDIPADSVYARAIRHVMSQRRARHPRVHPQMVDSAEIINWGTSGTVRKMLLGWSIKGNVKARRAGLYTPYFPVRNRVRDFNVEFNNDSVVLSNVQYKLGASDFLISGKISNMKRGFTSRGFRSPLKINFEMLSDTIDVNELASATFRGSAYAAKRESEGLTDFSLGSLEQAAKEDDEAFEREMCKIVADAPDSLAPLLIPKNIDASLNIKAHNIIYSDMLFHDFSGELLASRGALNLHNLKASSQMGNVNLSALYSSPDMKNIKFGFGMQVERFNIEKFIKLMPAIDSIMPLLRDFGGIIDADVAATCDIDDAMNLELPSLEAAIRISGDSLVVIDPDTYKTIGKWLMFKDKQSNIIKHMNAEMTIKNNMMQLYPFIFDLDRYKLGVQGHNDLNMNFDYHVAVLKSPLPFKFGINIKGNIDDYKIRLGKARLNERQVASSVPIVDTTRVNLMAQIESVFRRGVDNSRFARLNIMSAPSAATIDLNADTISHADSLIFIKEGLIPAPLPPAAADETDEAKSNKEKKKNKNKNKKKNKDTAIILRYGEKDKSSAYRYGWSVVRLHA